MSKQYELYDEYDEFKNLTRIYRVTITIDLEMCNPIAASIKPLEHADGSEDTLAMDEYTDFIINTLVLFDVHDFVVLEERESPYSHSYYCTLVKKDDYGSADYKYILYIRLSDHNNRKTQEQKQPKTKSKQTWRLKEITVNKDTFNSYDDALDYIDKILP